MFAEFSVSFAVLNCWRAACSFTLCIMSRPLNAVSLPMFQSSCRFPLFVWTHIADWDTTNNELYSTFEYRMKWIEWTNNAAMIIILDEWSRWPTQSYRFSVQTNKIDGIIMEKQKNTHSVKGLHGVEFLFFKINKTECQYREKLCGHSDDVQVHEAMPWFITRLIPVFFLAFLRFLFQKCNISIGFFFFLL